MRTLIMQAAAAELGGLVHRYQLDMGTVGGALVRGDEHPSPSILDLVRTVTVYAPASKRRPEGAVLTMPGSWLRVHEQPRLIPAAHPLPTVLSMQVQLTALRPDELQRRLQPHVQRVRHEQPAENTACIGPVFHVQESVDLRDMLHGARVLGLKRDGVHLSSQYPNYLMISPGTTTRQVTVFIQEVVARVHDTYGVTLEPIVQVIGNYPFGVVSSSTHAAL
jgi:UDP-N-acetylenolpyruvoylglucosamine reductase